MPIAITRYTRSVRCYGSTEQLITRKGNDSPSADRFVVTTKVIEKDIRDNLKVSAGLPNLCERFLALLLCVCALCVVVIFLHCTSSPFLPHNDTPAACSLRLDATEGAGLPDFLMAQNIFGSPTCVRPSADTGTPLQNCYSTTLAMM